MKTFQKQGKKIQTNKSNGDILHLHLFMKLPFHSVFITAWKHFVNFTTPINSFRNIANLD